MSADKIFDWCPGVLRLNEIIAEADTAKGEFVEIAIYKCSHCKGIQKVHKTTSVVGQWLHTAHEREL